MGHLVERIRMHALGIASAIVGLAITGPLLAPGFVLAYDMAFSPSPPLSHALLGASRNLPRSVPTGLFVSLASRALTGQVVEKLILFGIFAGAAYGAARLVPATRVPARVAAGLLYAWNPFMYERLLLGHWTLLLAYAALPWVAGAALAYRQDRPGSWAGLTLALSVSVAAGPYGGLFAAALAASLALFPRGGARGRRAAGLLVTLMVVNLPWLIPGLLHQAVPDQPALALRLFRARSDSPLGTLGSLLSLGGLWRTDLAPPGRHGGAWIPAFCLIVAVAVWGWRRLRDRWPAGAARGLVVLAVLGLLLAVIPSLPLLPAAVRWASGALPGGALLRDSQKFVIPFALLGAMAFGAGVDRILDGLSADERAGWAAALLLSVLPVALAPTLVWGAGGRLSPVRYPPSWGTVESVMEQDAVPGAVMALPWHAYLPFAWNNDRTVRQPAAFYFSRPVVADSSLQVGPHKLPAEDPWSRLAAPAVTGGAPLQGSLARLGVRYVVLFKEADWRPLLPRLAGLGRVVETRDLALYRAPPPDRIPRFAQPPIIPILAADALTLAMLVGAVVRLRASGPSPEGPVILRSGSHRGARSRGQ